MQMLNQWQVYIIWACHILSETKKNGQKDTILNKNSLPPKNDFKVVDDKERKVTNKVGLLNA